MWGFFFLIKQKLASRLHFQNTANGPVISKNVNDQKPFEVAWK